MNTEIRLSDSEYHIMEIIWENEPLTSMELAGACLERYGWKKSTTYTILKKVIEKNAAQNENTKVTSLISKNQVVKQESEDLLNKSFAGSLPDFFAAFLQDRKITKAEAEKIKKMINDALIR